MTHHKSPAPQLFAQKLVQVNKDKASHCWHFVRGIHQWQVYSLNSLRPRQNGRHFADDTFNRIFLNENVWIPIKISLKFVPRGPVSNIPSLVQIMAWRRPGDKPLSEPVMVSLLMHICVARPQWVNKGPVMWKALPCYDIIMPVIIMK